MKTLRFKIQNTNKVIRINFHREETDFDQKTQTAEFHWFAFFEIFIGNEKIESGSVSGILNENELYNEFGKTYEIAEHEFFHHDDFFKIDLVSNETDEIIGEIEILKDEDGFFTESCKI